MFRWQDRWISVPPDAAGAAPQPRAPGDNTAPATRAASDSGALSRTLRDKSRQLGGMSRTLERMSRKSARLPRHRRAMPRKSVRMTRELRARPASRRTCPASRGTCKLVRQPCPAGRSAAFQPGSLVWRPGRLALRAPGQGKTRKKASSAAEDRPLEQKTEVLWLMAAAPTLRCAGIHAGLVRVNTY